MGSDGSRSDPVSLGGDSLAVAIAEMYAAAVEPELWPRALGLAARLLGHVRLSLRVENRKLGTASVIATGSDNVPDALPPPGGRAPAPSEIGRVVVIDDPALHAMSAGLLRDDDISVAVRAERPATSPKFERSAVALFERLVPHLQRAVRTQRMLADAESRWTQASNVLDRLATGVLLLDSGGRVLFANCRAQDFLDARRVLTTLDGVLQAVDDAAHVTLREAIARAAAGAATRPAGGEALLLPRGGLGRPIVALVTRLNEPSGWLARLAPAVAVFVTDPERPDDTPEAILAALYGLTRAEAALTAALLSGQGLPRAAARLRISLNTAKTHLKRIFDKTGTRHQAELIRLILTGPGSVRFR